jgi:anti-sigma factor RsiW
MSDSRSSERDLHAYLDGELSDARRPEVEAYIAANPDEALRLAEYRRNDDTLRARFEPVLHEPLPVYRFAKESAGAHRVWRYVAALVWLGVGGVIGWHLNGVQGGDPAWDAPQWTRRALVAHVVYAPEVRHPVEVGADQEAHLAAWLSKRLGVQLRVPHLNSVGYALVGGRLLPGDQGPVAQFMYEDGRGQRLTLYVRQNRERYNETAFRFAQDGGVRVFYWIDRGLGYALSGEISKEDLLRTATAVYQQLNP